MKRLSLLGASLLMALGTACKAGRQRENVNLVTAWDGEDLNGKPLMLMDKFTNVNGKQVYIYSLIVNEHIVVLRIE